MTNITIFGSGIIGLSIASQLPKAAGHRITIAARDLPGDDPTSQGWASPWACAGSVALGGSPAEQKMQLDALTFLRKLAVSHPESGVRITEITDVNHHIDSVDNVWFRDKNLPGYRVVDDPQEKEAALRGAKGGVVVKYDSIVTNPGVLLPWLRKQLEESGVDFRRIPTVGSLAEVAEFLGLRGDDDDILINASGLANMTLADVRDDKMICDRTYTTLVESDYKGSFLRRGPVKNVYTYFFGRGDGTAVLGGVSEAVDCEVRRKEGVREILVKLANENLPEVFTSGKVEDYTFVGDMMGVRPLYLDYARVEKDKLASGLRVVHAYGTTAGGYMYCFGLGREVAKLVDEFVFDE